MGWEPITYCPDCGEPHDVYMPPENRVCECCLELRAEMEAERKAEWLKNSWEEDNERAS